MLRMRSYVFGCSLARALDCQRISMNASGNRLERAILDSIRWRLAKSVVVMSLALAWLTFVLIGRPDPVSLIAWIVICGLAALFSGRSIIRVRRWRRDWRKHPHCRQLARYGDLGAVLAGIERELQTAEVIPASLAVFTANFLFRPVPGGVQVARVRDITQAYLDRTRYTLDFVIPLGSSYAVTVVEGQRRLTFSCSDRDEAVSLLATLRHRNPSMRLGV